MSHEYTFIEDLRKQLPEIPPDSIISRTYYQDEHQKVILFGFAAGEELSEHTAARPAVLHILEGDAHLTLGEDSYDVKAGAWVHMPANLPHSVEAKTELVMLLMLLPAL